jgi:4-hydroxy-3-methylbut-2-enyl diphosphate reductase
MYVFKDLTDMPQIDLDIPFAVLSQTTLNYEYVKNLSSQIAAHYPEAIFPPLTDICKATYDRQTVIIQHESKFDSLIVIGGKESHNTKELVKL